MKVKYVVMSGLGLVSVTAGLAGLYTWLGGVRFGAPADMRTASPSSPTTSSGSEFRDGEYVARGSFGTPDGPKSISIKVSLRQNLVRNATVLSGNEASSAKPYTTLFRNGFKPYVVGKDIAGLKLAKISGASLTTKGFNRAIQDIRAQAQGS